MEDRVALYEEMMVNAGKDKSKIWNTMAVNILKDSYGKDKKIYESETRELYAILFEDATLFESIDEKENSLNEWEGWETQQQVEMDAAKNLPKLSGFGSFAKKIKDLFATMGGSVSKYFSNGIAGVVANPLPLVAAGASVGLIVALIAKFKKMSDAKKAKALAALSAEQKKKAEAVLAKDPAEFKKELEAKAKPGIEKEATKMAASADTDKKEEVLKEITMDYNLKVFGDYLVENFDDEELAVVLKENFNPSTQEAINYALDNLITETKVQDMMDELKIKDAAKVVKMKEGLQSKIENKTFTAEDALNFAAELYAVDTTIEIPKEAKEKIKKNIKIIQKMAEPRKTRTAKLFAFQMMSALNKKIAEMAKRRDGATRTITTEAGKTVVQSMKGKNDNPSVRHEVQRKVKEEGFNITSELEQIDKNMATESKAKIYCGILFKSFVQEQFEGEKKVEQFDELYRKMKSQESDIAGKASTQGELEIGMKQRVDWNSLNAMNLMKEIKDYSKGTSKLSLSQIKAVITKLKSSNFEALDLVDKMLSGRESKESGSGTQTKQRGSQA